MIYDEFLKNLLNDNEQQFVLNCFSSYTNDSKTYISTKEYDQLNQNLHQILNKSDSIISNNQYFSFDSCATNIIDRLFKENVDDDTLIITTKQEHPKVNKILNKYTKKLYLFDDYNMMLTIDTLYQQLKKYKKVFVYIIGTTCGVGKKINQDQLKILKYLLVKCNIKYVFVLDAVQELFLTPRDYSIFDYVIGTAHALIPNYNQGIVISKDKPYIQSTNYIAKNFYNLLEIVLKRKKYLSTFSILLTDYFYENILKFNLMYSNYSGHLFSIGDKQGTLLSIIPENQKTYDNVMINKDDIVKSILFRATWSIFDNIINQLDTVNDLSFTTIFNKTVNFFKNYD